MPYDPERSQFIASYRTKQLIVLSGGLMLERAPRDAASPAAVADALVEWGALPACYHHRYDADFLRVFHHVLALTRNLLVSDSPYLPDTAAELAAHAIFGQASAILNDLGEGWTLDALDVDPDLPSQIRSNRAYLLEELAGLRDEALEDVDVAALFSVPTGDEPENHLGSRAFPDQSSPLLFANWRVPFGSVPAPVITYDGRAWPTSGVTLASGALSA